MGTETKKLQSFISEPTALPPIMALGAPTVRWLYSSLVVSMNWKNSSMSITPTNPMVLVNFDFTSSVMDSTIDSILDVDMVVPRITTAKGRISSLK